jgi:hypothetical protein
LNLSTNNHSDFDSYNSPTLSFRSRKSMKRWNRLKIQSSSSKSQVHFLSEYLMTHFIQSVHALVTPFRQGQFSEHQLFRIDWLHCFFNLRGVGVEIFKILTLNHCRH